MNQTTEEILAERGKTHGKFKDHAHVTQHLKSTCFNNQVNGLTEVQSEALDMILHKIGRIVSGNPNIADHWDDIAGYAKLASNEINGVQV